MNTTIIGVVTGAELRPGMQVSKVGQEGKPKVETIPTINRDYPKCAHGYHFGKGCYDFIGSWFQYGKVSED